MCVYLPLVLQIRGSHAAGLMQVVESKVLFACFTRSFNPISDILLEHFTWLLFWPNIPSLQMLFSPVTPRPQFLFIIHFHLAEPTNGWQNSLHLENGSFKLSIEFTTVTLAKKIIKMSRKKINNLVMARNFTTSRSIFSRKALEVHDGFMELGQTLLTVHGTPKM